MTLIRVKTYCEVAEARLEQAIQRQSAPVSNPPLLLATSISAQPWHRVLNRFHFEACDALTQRNDRRAHPLHKYCAWFWFCPFGRDQRVAGAGGMVARESRQGECPN